MVTIKLESSDKEIFETDVEIAKCFGTIKTMLEDWGVDSGEKAVLPLLNVNSIILRKMLEWAAHHKDDPPPPLVVDEFELRRSDNISAWDAAFLKVDHGTLLELIMAANYLDVKDLLEAGCKTVANMIKGKTPEEMRKTFNITNDYTGAEEKQLREENKWCEEN